MVDSITPDELAFFEAEGWRISPLGYATHFEEQMEAPRHLQLVSNAVVNAVLGLGPNRIIVTMPPRHGKSQLVSRWTPVWFLDNWPHRRVMLGSYEATYAASWGKIVRETIRDYDKELRVKLSPETTARAAWDTAQGGYMVSQGVGGSLTGRGAELLIIDDPIKNAATAQSAIARDNLWDWWLTTAYTRLEPGGVALVVMTRWHEDDLVGRIVNQMEAGGEPWFIIRIPAIAEENDPLDRRPGQALWPERYNENALELIRSSVDEYTWESMYQQHPYNPGGTIFRRAWFEEQRYDATNPQIQRDCVARWLSWDTAMKDTDMSAYSALTVGELSPDYRLHIREVFRDRLDFPNLMAQVHYFSQKYNLDGKLHGIIIEDQASGASLYQTMLLNMDPEYADMLVPFMPAGSKEQRARQVTIWCRNGSVLLPHPHQHGNWLYEFEEELFGFPTMTYADQVDSFVQLIQYVEHLLEAGYRGRGGRYVDHTAYEAANLAVEIPAAASRR